MKNNIRFVIFVTLLVGLTTVVLAQRKSVTAKDFEKVDAKAKDLLLTTSYRVSMTTKWYDNKGEKPVSITKFIKESVPPDRTHTWIERIDEGKITKSERIVIGPRNFERKGTGPWTELSSSGGSGMGLSPDAMSIDYYCTDGVPFEDTKADMFEVERKTKFTINGKSAFSLYKATYWFHLDGRLLKMVSELDDKSWQSNHSSEIYEYDPNIKIEAPIK